MRRHDAEAADRGLAYADPRYAASLQEFGDPVELPRSGGWLLSRGIPGSSHTDAMGSYPLFSCQDWSRLGDDLAAIRGDPVSVTVVTDPFGAPTASELGDVFDVVVPYKDHYLVDLEQPAEAVVARHHRKSARKALQVLTIEPYVPADDLATWNRLYGHLVDKHGIDGIRAFSPAAFAVQSGIDGLVGFKATRGDETLGMHWYLTAGDVVYAHLAAMHPDSYAVGASHGLFWTAIEHFAGRYRWLDLGAAACTALTANDGLSQFKAGWSSATCPTYVCGKVLDRERYQALVAAGADGETTYFPAYRRGEFDSAPTGGRAVTEASYPGLVEACEALYREHGDTYRGVGWTKSQEHTDRRYDVMLDVMRHRRGPVTLLDFGCGTAHLLEHIESRGIDDVSYSGLDVSARFIEVARTKHPDVPFHLGDLLAGDVVLPTFDYVIMNGLFTYRGPQSFEQMESHWRRLVTAVIPHAEVGIAFNVMSPYVDWRREDLFHAPISMLTDFVAASACPYFVVRHDYGLFESTVHAYRAPTVA